MAFPPKKCWGFNIDTIGLQVYRGQRPSPLYKSAYATLGYNDCDNPGLEGGVEKIAVYDPNDMPKHVARRLGTGRWTSKLGDLKGIDHATLEFLEGTSYCYPVAIMGRPRVR